MAALLLLTSFAFTTIAGYKIVNINIELGGGNGVGGPAENSSTLESIVQLSPRVVRVLGQNPGAFTLQGTNTYLVGTGAKRILIDAGEPKNEKYLKVLRAALKGRKISSIVCTHGHDDHVGGVDDVIKSNFCDSGVKIYKIRSSDVSKHRDYYSYVEDGHTISVEGATLKVVTTPGHTTDHAALWLEEESALFSGDCILGQGSTTFEDLSAYLASLYRIKTLKPTVIYPGHGPVVEKTAEKIDQYIQHRLKRENDILKYFEEVKEASSMDVVERFYKDSPVEVREGALGNVRQHLLKLVKDKRLEEVRPDYFKHVPNPPNSL